MSLSVLVCVYFCTCLSWYCLCEFKLVCMYVYVSLGVCVLVYVYIGRGVFGCMYVHVIYACVFRFVSGISAWLSMFVCVYVLVGIIMPMCVCVHFVIFVCIYVCTCTKNPALIQFFLCFWTVSVQTEPYCCRNALFQSNKVLTWKLHTICNLLAQWQKSYLKL